VSKQKRDKEPFAQIPLEVLQSEAYRWLPHFAVRVLVALAAKYNGYNNGGLELTVRDAAVFGINEDELFAGLGPRNYRQAVDAEKTTTKEALGRRGIMKKRVSAALSLTLIAASVAAADYPDVPLDQLLTPTQQLFIGTAEMDAGERESLRLTLIAKYRDGFEKGKQEGSKTAARVATAPSVIESQIDGDFEGWEGETIVKLMNGQIWQQAEYHYDYDYSFMAEVVIYRSGGSYKMKVEGIDEAVRVIQLK
jgi:hypothetical protein